MICLLQKVSIYRDFHNPSVSSVYADRQLTLAKDGETVHLSIHTNKSTLLVQVSAQDHGNSRPSFKADQFFDFDVDQQYSRVGRLNFVYGMFKIVLYFFYKFYL